jgi:hypothetical protein
MTNRIKPEIIVFKNEPEVVTDLNDLDRFQDLSLLIYQQNKHLYEKYLNLPKKSNSKQEIIKPGNINNSAKRSSKMIISNSMYNNFSNIYDNNNTTNNPRIESTICSIL